MATSLARKCRKRLRAEDRLCGRRANRRFRKLRSSSKNGRGTRTSRRLRFERLEDRRVLSHILHVDADASLGGTGAAWDDALVSLQSALDRAAVLNADADPVNDIAEIWIAEGNYKPTAQLESDDVRSATFSLVSGVSLIGGFEGGETTVDERAVVNGEFQHEAILSGDLGTPDDNSDNAYTVVYCGENIEAGVDGVSVSGGNADVSSDSSHSEKRVGGGIYSRGTVTVTNSTLSGNSAIHGGGIINYGTLTVTNSTLSGNSASQKGGGILNAGTLTVTNSTLASNSAGDDGGWISKYK